MTGAEASEAVGLRPVTAADLDFFEREFTTEEGTGTFQWFGFTPTLALRQGFEKNGLLGPDGGALAVLANDEVVGRVEWFRTAWGRSETSWCWTIAVGLAPAFREQGIGTEAQRLLLAYLFDHTRAQRVQAYTDVDNAAEQQALEKAGFEREGVLRSAQWRDGAWHDLVIYAALRP
jgi:aminoglycoside 6'-N-acetyltransferase